MIEVLGHPRQPVGDVEEAGESTGTGTKYKRRNKRHFKPDLRVRAISLVVCVN